MYLEIGTFASSFAQDLLRTFLFREITFCILQLILEATTICAWNSSYLHFAGIRKASLCDQLLE